MLIRSAGSTLRSDSNNFIVGSEIDDASPHACKILRTPNDCSAMNDLSDADANGTKGDPLNKMNNRIPKDHISAAAGSYDSFATTSGAI